jgi:hypothetical protein
MRGGTGSDIRVVDSHGLNDRAVLQAERPNVYYDYPRWSADGNHLLITRAENIMTLDEHAQLQWVDVRGTAAGGWLTASR